MPSEYGPGKCSAARGRRRASSAAIDEANEILGLMMPQWNTIAATLYKGEPYLPLLLEGEDGVVHGNDWARGFMRGMLINE